jgi:hypothetical protein
MYPIEKAMKVFKGYICNKAKLKASMVKSYIYDETIMFVNYQNIFHSKFSCSIIGSF